MPTETSRDSAAALPPRWKREQSRAQGRNCQPLTHVSIIAPLRPIYLLLPIYYFAGGWRGITITTASGWPALIKCGIFTAAGGEPMSLSVAYGA